jgi:predicted metal-dependent HD superfamily phosphohydrolase
VDDDERVVRDAWRRLGGRDAVIDDVIARHREPHRRYHTVAHVAWVLRVAEELLAAGPGAAVETGAGAGAGADADADADDRADADAVRVAGIFHDVVYDPRAGDNEAHSADIAGREALALGWPEPRAELVRTLVLATAQHEPAGGNESVLLDADLSILGAAPDVYASYVRGVRAEYGHVDDEGWRAGRSAVLRRFLDRPSIYATAAMRVRAEEPARGNLRAELSTLTG